MKLIEGSPILIKKAAQWKASFDTFFKNLLLQDDEEPLQFGNLKDINERLALKSILEYLPHQHFDPETEIYDCVDTQGIAIEACPLNGASDHQVQIFYTLLQRILPEGTLLHCLLYASPQIGSTFQGFMDHRSHPNPLIQAGSQRRAAFYQKAVHQSLIPGQGIVLRDYRLLISLVFDHSLKLDTQKIQGFKNALLSALKGAGMQAQVLKPEALMAWLDALLNPSAALEPRSIEVDEHHTLAMQVAQTDSAHLMTPSKIFVYQGEQSHFQIRNFRVQNFKDRSPHLSQMSDLIGHLFDRGAQIGCPFSLSFMLKICDQGKEQRVAQARAFRSRQRAEKIARFSPQAMEEAVEARQIIQELEHQERLVEGSFQISLYCPNESADECESQLLNVFQASSLKWPLVKNVLLHFVMLLGHLPLAQSQALFADLGRLGLIYKLWAKNAAHMLPLIAEMKGMSTPRLLLACRRGQILCWDPFGNNRGNYNVCVCGISGSGKSVTVQEIVCGLVGSGGRVFIIDVGRSYKKITELLEGEFIAFNKETPLCLNPFSTVIDLEDFLGFMVPFVCLMIDPEGHTASIESAYIAKAVKAVWDKKAQAGSMSDIAQWLLDHPDPRAQDLGVILYPYTLEGPYSTYFNGKANVDFNNPMVVFELEEISGNKGFQSLIFMLLMYHVAEKMYLGARTQQTALIVDEAWDLLKGGHGGAIIESIARRARKYKGCLITITQSIADYFASAAGMAAYTNSYWKLIHMQNQSDIVRLVDDKKLILDPFQKKLLCSVSTEHGLYSEMMILGDGQECAVGRLFLDPYARILYSTQAKDFEAVNAYCAKGMSLAEAILQVSEERFG
jgi:conjugal transfer ATP-binding protein TraC